MMPWLIVALVAGALLVLSGGGIRQSRGLGEGRTLELDDRDLYSPKFGLGGRPDRIVEGGIPEEWKSSIRVYDSHRAQLAVYFALIEEEYGVRPPYGVIVTGEGTRHRVENTPEIRAWVLEVAEKIRAAGRKLDVPIPVNQSAAKCRACGIREGCGMQRG